MTSPNTLARFGIGPDLYRAGHPWFCRPCNVRLQNGLSGAREHYDQVHIGGITPALYLVQ